MSAIDLKEGFVTVEDAARMLLTTHLKVLMLIKQRTLEGVMVEGEWRVNPAAIEALRLQERDVVFQPACRTSCTASGCHCK